MRLLEWDGRDVRLKEFHAGSIPDYAILSHTWGQDHEEVSFQDIQRNAAKNKSGYKKIEFCIVQAGRDNLKHFWIDTCCIDKHNAAELQESLNSMFRWYKHSKKCYVYLPDVSTNTEQAGPESGRASWEAAFRKSKWFTRGWTLQELIAPSSVAFFSEQSQFLGDKVTLESLLEEITGIPAEALRGGPLSQFSVQARFEWMQKRETKREEDKAHALQGIFDVFVPTMYGWGVTKAIERLHKEIQEAHVNNISITDADNYLNHDYYSDERLKIERLSGKRLPMEHCYINLAIIKTDQGKPVEEEPQDKSSPFALAHRLKTQDPNQDVIVDLATLFDTREDSDNNARQIRRVLIRGRAGVGKTTLCKKIVFEFQRQTLWNNLFERILWVPLRGLKSWPSNECNLRELLHHHYFRHHQFGVTLADRLAHAIDFDGHQSQHGKTLFILDGLDEVSNTWNSGDAKYDLLVRLLNQPNVIITTRPHAQIPQHVARHIDLEVETIGFSEREVEEYLDMAFLDRGKVAKAEEVLRKFALIQSLVRIPILLDAFCYTWDPLSLAGNHTTTQTMTSFYRVIVQELLRKDVVRSENRNGLHVTETTAAELLSCQLEAEFEEHLRLLENIAFAGMYNDTIEFEPHDRNIIWKKYGHYKDLTLVDQCLRSSFLRISDPNEGSGNVSYHFLHLTFQEFFAAKCFVRQWISGEHILCLDLSSKTTRAMPKDEFLARYKYEPRYDIFWRFVAGIIESQDQEEAARFFRMLEDPQSRDLLGPAHQRLIVHCLAEVSPQMSLRPELEMKLEEWLAFEAKFTQKCKLAREMEFPERILCKILDSEDKATICEVLEAVGRRATIANTFLPAIIACLGDEDCTVRWAAAHTLRSRVSDPRVQQALLNRFHDQDCFVRQAAAEALSSRASDPQVQRALLAQLHDDDAAVNVRRAAAHALSSQASDPKVKQALLAKLDGDTAADVRWAVAEALRSQAFNPRVQQALLARFHDDKYTVRRAAASALSSQASDAQVQQALLARLHSQDHTIRRAAAEALRSQASDPQVQQALLAQLGNDAVAGVRWAAANALSSRTSNPQVQQALLARLCNDDTANVRRGASRALSSQTSDARVQQTLLAQLKKESTANVRWAIVEALRSQVSNSQVRQALLAQLYNDAAANVRMGAARALSSQASDLRVQEVLLARVNTDAAANIRWAAVDALSSRASNPQVQQALVDRLEDDSTAVVRAAVDALHLNGFSLFDKRHIKQFYNASLDRSFTRHYCWQLQPNGLRLITPQRTSELFISDQRIKILKKARADHGTPDVFKPSGIRGLLRRSVPMATVSTIANRLLRLI
ncbi:unnamed protein product [Clonostachys rosea]|uniref:NACHT domain-containing protein n=1 Tax=Bionectria ochroleuca TaxID=29856 RepID=A0ABY6UX94_BIOOC|nr:unnamed protein product [Clonostachys rosea]